MMQNYQKPQVWRRCFTSPKPLIGPPQPQVKLITMVKLLGKLLQKSATKLLVGFQGRGHSIEDVLEPSERGGQGADEQAAGRDARGEHTVIIALSNTEKRLRRR